MRELSQLETFKECIALTDKAIEKQYDLELVLRFIVFRTLDEDGLKKAKDVGAFLQIGWLKLLSPETSTLIQKRKHLKSPLNYYTTQQEVTASANMRQAEIGLAGDSLSPHMKLLRSV